MTARSRVAIGLVTTWSANGPAWAVPPAEPLLELVWEVDSGQQGAGLGISVASAGDVDGDGYDELVVGAYTWDGGEVNEGAAFVYRGSATGLDLVPAWTFESDQEFALFGWKAAPAGDVNGDGYDDLLIGALEWDGPDSREGRVYLYPGSAGGLTLEPSWTVEGDQVDAYLGIGVAGAGDVNGDGYDDVVIGASGYTDEVLGQGRASLYLGSAAGLALEPSWTDESDQVYSGYGRAVASAGDVDGDGYDDVLVGAFGMNSAFLYHGSATGLATEPAWTVSSQRPGDALGADVSSAGDVNGDGYDDVLVSAPAETRGQTFEGVVYLYLGSNAGLAASPAWFAQMDESNAQFGLSAAGVGDLNADGYDDVAIGAPYLSRGGGAWVWYGATTGLGAEPAWSEVASRNNALYGASVAGAGDIDGDGFADLAIGAPGGGGRGYLHRGGCYQPLDADADADGIGDTCDSCPSGDDRLDTDQDTVADECDVCSGGDDRLDADADGIPDGCDPCPIADDGADTDDDGLPDACDRCPSDADPSDGDDDADGVGDACDICPDGDDLSDEDGDLLPNACDDCPSGPCEEAPPPPTVEQEPDGCGCDTGPPVAGLWWIVLVAGGRLRGSSGTPRRPRTGRG